MCKIIGDIMWYTMQVFDRFASYARASIRYDCSFRTISPLSNQGKLNEEYLCRELSFGATEDAVRSLFEAHGAVDV